MALEQWRSLVTCRPGRVVGFWLALALVVGLLAPDLTRLAAEGQSRMLGDDAESRQAAAVVAQAWPEQAYDSLAVAALHRPGGLSDLDRAYARRLGDAVNGDSAGRPKSILRVYGPASEPELAERLTSRDGTLTLVAFPISESFVSPKTHDAADWLEALTNRAELKPPAGLEVSWTGDAILGRDYMDDVHTSLNRAAVLTVVLLLAVLLIVYRSLPLALVPLVTIVLSLIISRALLAWMSQAGWEISSLVELFLVAVLFGSGTDFCLFISWRYAEHWDPNDPEGAMQVTLRRAYLALLTSAGTVIVGLLLMGTTKFSLFSSTGPSVAIGLAVTLLATLTLTPALLVLLARYRPQAFRGFTSPETGFWEKFAGLAMSRPLLSWVLTLALMVPLVRLGLDTTLLQDLLSEMPPTTPSAKAFRLVSSKFDPGLIAPLTVVLESDSDLRQSEGLALIDDLSRFLAHQRSLSEVRSATQPLGSLKTLAPARIASRLGAVNSGFGDLVEGAGQLQRGLNEGAAKLRAALWIEENTGISLTGGVDPKVVSPAANEASRAKLLSGLRRASGALLGTGMAVPWDDSPATTKAKPKGSEPPPAMLPTPPADDPRHALVRELTRAAEGAGQIAGGATRARNEVASILADPVGHRALDRLLVTPETLKQHPELLRSFAVYITPDGRHARISLSQVDRVFSAGAMESVVTVRRRLNEFLDEVESPRISARVTGANAESADIRALTRADQFQSWFVVPIGVFLVLLVALRDPLACFNLVATMLLTYVFALGATHFVFITILGADGLDWKVPYFLFVLLVAVGVDYNVFLMARLHEEAHVLGLRPGIVRAVGQTGGLITSAAAITACSFASFLSSPLSSLRQLGFALVVGLTIDALVVRPLLVPCGHWLLARARDRIAELPRIESA